jgi:hypothetical protein
MEEKEKFKAPRVPLTWLDERLEDLKFSYYDLARLYAHDKEQANSAISILSRYYRAVESYFQWLAWDKNLAKNSVQNYLKDQPGLYEIGDVDLPDPKYEVPVETQYLLLLAIDPTDYYKMGLDDELNDAGSNADYKSLLDELGLSSDDLESLQVNVPSLAIINTIRGINLDEESRKSAEPTEAADVLNEITFLESRINSMQRREDEYLKNTKSLK